MTRHIPVLVALLCTALVTAGAGCLALQFHPTGEHGPADQVIHPEFFGEGIGTDGYLQYRLVPETDTAATYLVTYEITRNGTTVVSRTGERFSGISRDNPITLGVPRRPGDRIEFHVTVHATDGAVVYTATMAGESRVASPLPTGP